MHTIGIIGAGQMGTGIAQVFAAAGYPVHLLDVTADRLTANSDQEAVDEVQALRHALDQLPEAQRQAILLVRLQDKSLAEAAVELGTNVGALKVSVHRALKRLKSLLGGE